LATIAGNLRRPFPEAFFLVEILHFAITENQRPTICWKDHSIMALNPKSLAGLEKRIGQVNFRHCADFLQESGEASLSDWSAT